MPAEPDLLIVAPDDPTRARPLAARMVELGIFFPFEMPAYRLPGELPDELRGFRGIVLPAEKAVPVEARLRAFERGGGFVMRMKEGDWRKESFIERIPVRCAARIGNPAMRARMEEIPDREVLDASLAWCVAYANDAWSDVLRYQIECWIEAFALTGEPTAIARAAALVDRAVAIQPRPSASCDHVACVYPILGFLEATDRRDMIEMCLRVVTEFVRSAPRTKGILSNFVRPDERGLARAEIAFQVAPACARLARITGETDFADLAVEQIVLLDRELSRDGLWVLGFGKGGRTPSLWGRGATFGLRGVADTLAELEPAHSGYATLRDIVQRMAGAWAVHQETDGSWRQTLDEASSARECSATAWATVGLAKALRLGWIPADFATCVEKGWRATKRHVWEGMPVNTCGAGTASLDPDYYRHRPFLRPSPYGHFPARAATEVLRLRAVAAASVADGKRIRS